MIVNNYNKFFENSNMGGCSLSYEDSSFYIIAEDGTKKKLGESITGYTRIFPSSPFTVTKTGTIFVMVAFATNSGTSGDSGTSAVLSGCTLVSPITICSNSKRLDGAAKIGIANKGDIVTFKAYAPSYSDWYSGGFAIYQPLN